MVISTNMLKERYSDYANPLDKIKREADKGALIRVCRGLYETDARVNPCFLAPHIVSPSYLSFDYALSYYGLIPEKVVSITSASLQLRKNKTFKNYFGRYEFSDIPASAYSEGLTYINEGDYFARIATKEKALCDSLYKWKTVHKIDELKELLFEDKRIDKDELMTCDFSLIMSLAPLYKCTNVDLFMKLIEEECK